MDRIGRYKIVRELGRGAMGVVYHAIDPNIGRPVAIKTIQFAVRQPEEQERLRERLFREARSAGMLSHPGIVTIYDVEQQGDVAYIAMEYVDGPTLDQVLSEPAALSPEQMFSVLGQTAVALDYAHLKGIVHRDIKPANIMITADGTAKIADFGIAKITAGENLTMTGSIVGTPHYMSPEQVQGKQVDGRSDQFSLAVIAYEILTGEKPFTGEHLTTVVYKIVAEEPVPPRRLNPGLGPAVETCLSRALNKKPEARYRNCQEFISALEAAGTAVKGWNPLPRGGSLNQPTVTDAPKVEVTRPAVVLPPPQRVPRTGEATTRETPKKSWKGFVPFLIGIVFVGGLLVAVSTLITTRTHTPASVAGKPKPPSTETPPESPARTPPASAGSKPSPLGGATGAPAAKPPARPVARQQPPPQQQPPATKTGEAGTRRPPARGGPQDIQVGSSPAGAIVTLDSNSAISCVTPCSLSAAPGRHALSITMVGYQIEHRYVTVGAGPVELPPVVLHTQGGTLMLSSDPPGATVLVDGRNIGQLTPATIPLPLGTYTVTVEKDGKQASAKVEVRSGGINYRKILLGQ